MIYVRLQESWNDYVWSEGPNRRRDESSKSHHRKKKENEEKRGIQLATDNQGQIKVRSRLDQG